MSTAEAVVPTSESVTAFPSLSAFRSAHGELLKLQASDSSKPELLEAIESFLRRGQQTGALLDSPEDRWSVQSALDYWASALYRFGLRDIDPTLADFDPELTPKLEDALCPYVGLEAFREGDRERFFGRARLIAEMVARLGTNRLLAALGPSGSGKSSVVLGGLLPALESGALPGSRDWRYLPPLVPGSDPLRNLARALLPAGAEAAPWISRHAEMLQEDPSQLAGLLAGQGEAPAVLVVDQFEELFTLCEDEAVRQAFVSCLLALLRNAEPRHVVVLTLRSDYEAFVNRLEDIEPYWEEAQVRVTPLGAAELREAIEKPAERVGLKFEDGVVQALLQDLRGEPAGLPLLQFTLLKLWEGRDRNRVTLAAYRKLGGGRLALAQCADELYGTLIKEKQDTARRIFLRIVRPSSGLEMTSCRIRKEDLYRFGDEPGRVKEVLDTLIGARLIRLTPGETPNDDQVEVAHEALVRNWPRLVDWLDEVRAEITTRRRLEARAADWVRLGRGRGGLLDDVELPVAERWLESSEANDLGYAQPVADLVQASRRAVNLQSRKRTMLRWGIPVLIVLYVLAWAGFAFLVRQKRILEESKAAVEELQDQKQRLEADRDQLRGEKMQLNTDKSNLALGMADLRETMTETSEHAAQAEKESRRQILAAGWRMKDAEARTREALALAIDTEQDAARRVQSAREELKKAEVANDFQRFEAQVRASEALRTLERLQKEAKEAAERRERLEKEIADGGGSQADTVPRLLKRTWNTLSRMIELARFRNRLRPVQAGGSTSTQRGLQGSICCVVHDADGTYLLSRTSVFDAPPGAPVLQPGLSEGPLGVRHNVVATLVRTGSNPNRSGAIARVHSGIGVDFSIPRLGKILGKAERPEIGVGTAVQMAGAGSGIQRGKILRFEDDGVIVTDIEPAPGDSGAPVVTLSRQIVGMLWGWSGPSRESYVVPIQQVLDDLKVDLGPRPPAP